LLSGCAEVSLNLLAPGEAVDLLLRTGEVEEVDEAASEAAAEIAELCGNLPLYLSICGGIILGYDGDIVWQTELIAMLLADRVGVIDDGSGDNTVERLVDNSLSMVKDESISLAFMALGVCPEDVLVVLPVVQLICCAEPQLVSKANNAIVMRRSIKVLLDRHLLQGSIASGVQMHDIVRDLVRLRLGGEDGIRDKQRVVVAGFVSACPAGGWLADDAVGQYAAQALEQHTVEALLPNLQDDTEAQAWLMHSEGLIAASAANALGYEALAAFSAAREAAGELVVAARVAWATRLVRHISAAAIVDLIYRAADLLESADDPSNADFESQVIAVAWMSDMGSERHAKMHRRTATLQQESGKATFESEWAKGEAAWVKGFVLCVATNQWPVPEADARDGARQMIQAILTHGVEAGKLTNNPSLQHAVALNHHKNLGFSMQFSHVPEIWNPDACGGEAALAESMEFYTYEVMGKITKAAFGFDHYRGGTPCLPLVLFFGNLPLLDKWVADVTAACQQLDFPRSYSPEAIELLNGMYVCVLLLRLNRSAQAGAVHAAMGFDWSEGGLALLGCFQETLASALPGFHHEADSVFRRLLVYLAQPQTAALDAKVSAWIPSPDVLARYEREFGWSMNFSLHGILALAARAFLQLGRNANAEEAACIAVSPAHHTLRKFDLVECHCVLGQVAAKRGDFQVASGHFERGMDEAKASRLPMLELLTARDWKRAISEYDGEADAVIDGACAAMGKSRAQLASVL
jgi:hypothetical protein